MLKKSSNKQITEGKGDVKNKKVEKEYTFPEHNLVIKASSPEEARKLLGKHLQGEDK